MPAILIYHHSRNDLAGPRKTRRTASCVGVSGRRRLRTSPLLLRQIRPKQVSMASECGRIPSNRSCTRAKAENDLTAGGAECTTSLEKPTCPPFAAVIGYSAWPNGDGGNLSQVTRGIEDGPSGVYAAGEDPGVFPAAHSTAARFHMCFLLAKSRRIELELLAVQLEVVGVVLRVAGGREAERDAGPGRDGEVIRDGLHDVGVALLADNRATPQ